MKGLNWKEKKSTPNHLANISKIGCYEIRKGVNYEGQNHTFETWGLKSDN